MVKRVWAFIAVLLIGSVLFFSFQNFTYKYKVKSKDSRQPASTSDFNTLIDDSQSLQKQLAQQLEKDHPPVRVEKDGLVKRNSAMKRQVIEDSGGSVVVNEAKPFFRPSQPKALQVDDQKNLERLSQEVEADRP